MVRLIPFKLDILYITNKLHTETATRMLGERRSNVIFSLYNIANGIKQRQHFLELEQPEGYHFSASITTNTVLVGEALQQFKNLRFRARQGYASPHYRIRVYLTDARSGKSLFDFEHCTSNRDRVYSLVNQLIKKINNILWKKD
jgi:hypothetical protein